MACYLDVWNSRAQCMGFLAVKTLRFTCLSIKLLCDQSTITTCIYNFSMTANLVIRMTTTGGESGIVWKRFESANVLTKFLEIWEWLKITSGLYYKGLPSRIGTLHTMKLFTLIGQVASKNISSSIMSTSIIMPSTSAVMPTSSSTTPPATTTPAPKFKVITIVYDVDTGKPCLWFRTNMRVNYHYKVCFNFFIYLYISWHKASAHSHHIFLLKDQNVKCLSLGIMLWMLRSFCYWYYMSASFSNTIKSFPCYMLLW